jgi:hypothetical protein
VSIQERAQIPSVMKTPAITGSTNHPGENITMKKALYVVLSFAMALPGCSIYKAATAPPPIALENVKNGASRITIVGTLGIPKMSETNEGSKIDVYEFVNGSHEATKARIVLYIAGDLFTMGLSELVFWPAELGLGQGTAGRAVVTYGMDDIAKSVLLAKADGSPWARESTKIEGNPAAVLPIAPKTVTPETGAITR